MVYRIPPDSPHTERTPVDETGIIPEPPTRKATGARVSANGSWNGELITVESGGEEIKWATGDIGRVIRMIYEMDEGDTVVINRT